MAAKGILARAAARGIIGNVPQQLLPSINGDNQTKKKPVKDGKGKGTTKAQKKTRKKSVSPVSFVCRVGLIEPIRNGVTI